ncbi:MAG TPA: monofunctional biosynthetic peptidoglycan transglycosylase [Deltaproteobacteria bacterium]|nr:monofunctional biosynthetic peptidoglycan transglycosylase [Deltaproteobacteria bacterium]
MNIFVRHWKKIVLGALIFFAAAFIVDIGRYFFYPDVKQLKKHNPEKTAFMEYRENIWRQKGVPKNIDKRWVPFSRISPWVVKAVIIAEDHKFWSHNGFDFASIRQALERNIRKGEIKVGGSTISQQLAKNLFLSPSKNPVRKIKEAILTWRLERNLSKKRIIELYLNVAEWGDGIFGIEAAAQHHFFRSASGLTMREAAMLAAILPSPLRYRTDGTSRYVENQADRIYQFMINQGSVIDEDEEVMSERDENIPLWY